MQTKLVYADILKGRLLLEGQTPAANRAYTLCSPWGTRTGKTDAQGKFEEHGLPPGGVTLVADKAVVRGPG